MLTLKYADKTAVVLPEYGFNTVSIRFGEKELLRTAPSMEVYAEDPCIWGIPTLLPPNRTEDGVFHFEGKRYALPINEERIHNHLHGYVHRSPFTVTARSENSAEGYFENHGEIFPFPFAIKGAALLDGTGYHLRFTVENIGGTNMPLVFALHANFRRPEYFRVPLGERWETTSRAIPTGNLLPLRETERAWAEGTAPKGNIGGFFTSRGHEAALDGHKWRVSENFDQWVLWSGEGFLSMEPQRGAVNALNNGVGKMILAPGERETFTAEVVE